MLQKWKILSLSLLTVFAYYVFFQMFYDMVAYHEMFPFQDMEELLLSVALNFPPVLLTFVLCVSVVRINKRPVKLKIFIDLFFCVLGLVAINYLYLGVVHLIFSPDFGHIDWAGTVFNLVIILLAVEVYYYHVNYMRQLRAVEEQRRMNLQHRYDALRAQISPHFLFNSLNILYALIGDGRPKAQQFVDKLGKIYQYVLFHQEQETVTLEEEMRFIYNYVDILKIRYYDAFQLKVEGEELVGSQRIIPFTLQLLVENVVKHNTVSDRLPMITTLVISEEGFTISNPIHKKYSEPSTSHVGLNYLQKLYQNYGCELRFGAEGDVFKVKVPFIKSENNEIRHY